jgi:general secretion pathway protein F
MNMGLYRYRALDLAGKPLGGRLNCTTREAAVSQLQEQGLIVLQVEDAALTAGRGWRRNNGLSARELTRFTQQLATLLAAGQPLERSLAILLRQPGQSRAGQLLARIRDRVKSGLALSAAMAQEQQQFSPLYLSLVRAGEAGGALGATLSQLTSYLERSQQVRGEVINALIYPAFLLVGVLGSLLLLMAYVVPQFVPIFEGLGVPTPLLTQIILNIGLFLADYGLYGLALLVGLAVWLAARWRQPNVRLAWDRRWLRLRIAGPLLQQLETARLTRTLGTLLTQGVPLLNALQISVEVCRNRAIQAAVLNAAQQVKDGNPLSSTLEAEKVLPDLALQMIQVGEESGQLDAMLLKVADIFDQESKRDIDRLLAALVPTLTLIMATLVAFIMLAIMLPLMSLTSNI